MARISTIDPHTYNSQDLVKGEKDIKKLERYQHRLVRRQTRFEKHDRDNAWTNLIWGRPSQLPQSRYQKSLERLSDLHIQTHLHPRDENSNSNTVLVVLPAPLEGPLPLMRVLADLDAEVVGYAPGSSGAKTLYQLAQEQAVFLQAVFEEAKRHGDKVTLLSSSGAGILTSLVMQHLLKNGELPTSLNGFINLSAATADASLFEQHYKVNKDKDAKKQAYANLETERQIVTQFQDAGAWPYEFAQANTQKPSKHLQQKAFPKGLRNALGRTVLDPLLRLGFGSQAPGYGFNVEVTKQHLQSGQYYMGLLVPIWPYYYPDIENSYDHTDTWVELAQKYELRILEVTGDSDIEGVDPDSVIERLAAESGMSLEEIYAGINASSARVAKVSNSSGQIELAYIRQAGHVLAADAPQELRKLVNAFCARSNQR